MPNNQTETSASKAPIGAAKPDAKYLSYRTDAVPTDSLWPEVPLSSYRLQPVYLTPSRLQPISDRAKQRDKQLLTRLGRVK